MLKSIIYINIGADKYYINKITISLGQTSHWDIYILYYTDGCLVYGLIRMHYAIDKRIFKSMLCIKIEKNEFKWTFHISTSFLTGIDLLFLYKYIK